MNVILFDTDRENLFPLSFTRPISDFRVGILTIKEKWEYYYNNVSVKTEDYLMDKFPINLSKFKSLGDLHMEKGLPTVLGNQ